jgi:hypothetical protein
MIEIAEIVGATAAVKVIDRVGVGKISVSDSFIPTHLGR